MEYLLPLLYYVWRISLVNRFDKCHLTVLLDLGVSRIASQGGDILTNITYASRVRLDGLGKGTAVRQSLSEILSLIWL